ncbi:response regulator transcription factor [Xylanimonas protaetiae]|uniref:Response regulator transcription factor n=1 Tax=Xylanimonas protaetiae TaxID=2509457 RepID=A0A4P6F7H8_9MICO|nr:response regulator transcription factor [Xylanimonas protaetiae]
MVAEDDPKQAELLRLYAQADGHAVTVVGDGREALEAVRREPPDVLVLDVMLPRVGGLDVARILRADPDPALSGLPILMVTARSAEDDLLLGLDLGADDYVAKPYSPRELMGRVRALARRTRPAPTGGGTLAATGATGAVGAAGASERVHVVGRLRVDAVRHEVHVGDVLVDLTPGEFALLSLLAAAPGRAFTREQLLQDLYGTDRYVSRRTVDMHVMNVRRKLATAADGAADATPAVVTVYGVGYKLAGGAP